MLEGTSQPIVPAADSSGTPRRDRAPVPCEPPARPDAAVEAESSRAPENARRTAEATAARHAAEVAALRRQVLEARKQAALGELLGTTAHEFNNALTTILNYARMGLRHRDQTTRDKALERILSAGTRAARIASSVLSMSRSRSPRLEPTDLVHVVEDVLVLLERELMKYRVQVEREFADVPRVMANPRQVQQVLVRDTGCGMTPEVMRRIFEPHFTTKAGPDETGKGGTGLGLASCREIVEAHRGRIRVESAPGRGTAITIRLPVPQAAAA